MASSYNIDVHGDGFTNFLRFGDTNLDSDAVSSSSLQYAGIVMQSSHYLNNIIDQNYSLTTLDYAATIHGKRQSYVAGSDTRFTAGSIKRDIKGDVATSSDDRTVISLAHMIDVGGTYTQKNDNGVFFFLSLFRNCDGFEGKVSKSVNILIGGPFMEITKGTGSTTSNALAITFNIGSGDMAANTDYVLTMGAAFNLFKYGLSFQYANDTENKTYVGLGMNRIDIKVGVLIYKKQDGSGNEEVHNEGANLEILIGVLSKIKQTTSMCANSLSIKLFGSASNEADAKLSTSAVDFNT